MKEWILYCVLCSLIYSLSVQAAQPMTAYLKTSRGEYIDEVLDCAIFLPNLEEVKPGLTLEVMNKLVESGFYPVDPTEITSTFVDTMTMKDSNGHESRQYETGYDWNRFVQIAGRGRVYLNISGVIYERTKSHNFKLRLFKLGKNKELVLTNKPGTLGMPYLNLSDLPRCYSK